jgi:hypothetical protein
MTTFFSASILSGIALAGALTASLLAGAEPAEAKRMSCIQKYRGLQPALRGERGSAWELGSLHHADLQPALRQLCRRLLRPRGPRPCGLTAPPATEPRAPPAPFE